MGGLFGAVLKNDCVRDVFFGTDYHSHLGTKRGGMVFYGEFGFERSIHNIENSPFRTKFYSDLPNMHGNIGLGCISDNEPQPLIVRSHLGNFAICTVGRINNTDELVEYVYKRGATQFLEMSGGNINPTELCAALINQRDTIPEGLRFAQEMIDGSMSMLLMTSEGIYAARDYFGRTPLIVAQKPEGFCVSFESSAYLNLGYTYVRDLGPAEIAFITAESCDTVVPQKDAMQICTFLWIYYGYPTSSYEGINVEQMRYNCGAILAKRDNIKTDSVAGVPDSGTAHAIGYANESGIPFARPFIKYTPTWPRSFMPPGQMQRDLIAHMKLIPVRDLIDGKRLLLIDDSIVRGTQMRETTEFLYKSGAQEVHIRPACPPIMFSCKYLNFSRSRSSMDLIARRIIHRREGDITDNLLTDYSNPDSKNYTEMVNDIGRELHFTSLRYHRLDDMLKSVGLPECKLCTYCWNGKEHCIKKAD